LYLAGSEMQKEVIEGVPYWKDKSNNLYSFELDKKNLINIGVFNSEKQKIVLKTDWEELYSQKLKAYRDSLVKRERKENKLK